jgi:hypothetical protein
MDPGAPACTSDVSAANESTALSVRVEDIIIQSSCGLSIDASIKYGCCELDSNSRRNFVLVKQKYKPKRTSLLEL